MPKISEWQNYGGLRVSGNTTAEPIVDGTLRKVTAWDDEMPSSDNVTVDPTINNDITLTDSGDYDIGCVVAFEGKGNETYEFEIFVNSVGSGYKTQRRISGSADVGSVGMLGILTLTAGAKISLYQRSLTGNAFMTVINAQLKVSRLSDE